MGTSGYGRGITVPRDCTKDDTSPTTMANATDTIRSYAPLGGGAVLGSIEQWSLSESYERSGLVEGQQEWSGVCMRPVQSDRRASGCE